MCIAKRRLAGVLTIVSVCLNLPAHSANEPHIESIRHTALQEKGGQIFTGGEPDEAIESQVDKRVNSFFNTENSIKTDRAASAPNRTTCS